MQFFWVVDVKAEFPNFGTKFTGILGRKQTYTIVAVFPDDFLCHLRSFRIMSGLLIRTDFYSNNSVFLGHFRSFVLFSIWLFTVVTKLLRL